MDAAAGDGGEGGPADDGVAVEGNKAAGCQVRLIPFFLGGGVDLEAGIAGGESGLVDGFDVGPLRGKHGVMVMTDFYKLNLRF